MAAADILFDVPVLALNWTGTAWTGSLGNNAIQCEGSSTLYARPVPAPDAPRFALTQGMIADNWTVVTDNNGAPGTTSVFTGATPSGGAMPFDVGFFYIQRTVTGDPSIQYNFSPNNNTIAYFPPGIVWITGLTITITPPVVTTPTLITPSTLAAGRARCVRQDNTSALQVEWTRQEQYADAMAIQEMALLVSASSRFLGLTNRGLLLTGIEHHLVAESDPPNQTWTVMYTLESLPGTDAVGSSIWGRLDEMRLDVGRLSP